MARSIVLSNGELAVALDSHGLVRDIYYPHVGLEDHVRGHYIHRVGVFADGAMHWFNEDPAWQITVSCEEESLASRIVARHPSLELELVFKDIVYNERNIFLRRVTVTNRSSREREIKLYFGHEFELYKSHGGDTAYFDPVSHALVHYKGHRVFLMSAALDGEPFGDWATGRMNFQGKQGTFRDTDDGQLSKNPVEHGPADSVLGLYASYTPGQSRTCYYAVIAAQSIGEAHELAGYLSKKTPEHLVKTASDYWAAWVRAIPHDFRDLSRDHITLFNRSLMYVRAHVDVDGGIIASCDSDMLQWGYDTYCYVWPRDAAYAAMALDQAGDTNVAKRFFEFCRDTVTDDGYFMHKYLPDKSLGSSWHPWVGESGIQLPIQEDETAIVVYALSRHFAQSHDLEFLEAMFEPLVERTADFMLQYRDPDTHLPLESYELWERKRGTSTYTASAVYAALIAAAELSRVLGKSTHETRYREGAREVRDAILAHLWDEKSGLFLNMTQHHGGVVVRDPTVDVSSVYGVFFFNVLSPDDPKLVKAWDNTVRALSHGVSAGGLARFEQDDYFRIEGEAAGNPWIITTLWYAEYLIARAKTDGDLARVRDIFNWVLRHAQVSGVLSEQLNPYTGEQFSSTPLAWSHATYVTTVLAYLERLERLGITAPDSHR